MIKLTGELVLIEEIPQNEKTDAGIFIPEQFRDKSNIGKIIAVGPGIRRKKDNKIAPTEVKAGDKVIFNENSTYPIALEGKKYLMLREKHIIAVLEGK